MVAQYQRYFSLYQYRFVKAKAEHATMNEVVWDPTYYEPDKYKEQNKNRSRNDRRSERFVQKNIYAQCHPGLKFFLNHPLKCIEAQ